MTHRRPPPRGCYLCRLSCRDGGVTTGAWHERGDGRTGGRGLQTQYCRRLAKVWLLVYGVLAHVEQLENGKEQGENNMMNKYLMFN